MVTTTDPPAAASHPFYHCMVDSLLDIRRGSVFLLPNTMTACCFARYSILLACLGMPLLAGPQVPPEREKLGNVHFPVSCSPDVIAHVKDKGIIVFTGVRMQA